MVLNPLPQVGTPERDALIAAVIRLCAAHRSCPEIAVELGLTYSQVYRLVADGKRLGLIGLGRRVTVGKVSDIDYQPVSVLTKTGVQVSYASIADWRAKRESGRVKIAIARPVTGLSFGAKSRFYARLACGKLAAWASVDPSDADSRPFVQTPDWLRALCQEGARA